MHDICIGRCTAPTSEDSPKSAVDVADCMICDGLMHGIRQAVNMKQKCDAVGSSSMCNFVVNIQSTNNINPGTHQSTVPESSVSMAVKMALLWPSDKLAPSVNVSRLDNTSIT